MLSVLSVFGKSVLGLRVKSESNWDCSVRKLLCIVEVQVYVFGVIGRWIVLLGKCCDLDLSLHSLTRPWVARMEINVQDIIELEDIKHFSSTCNNIPLIERLRNMEDA